MAEKSQWYYVDGQDRKGPVTDSAIRQLASQGVVNGDTLVWKEGMKDWEPAQTVNGLIEKKPESLPKVNVSGAPSGKTRTQRTAPTTVQPVEQPVAKPVTGAGGPSSNRPTPIPVSTPPAASVSTAPAASFSAAPADSGSMDVAIQTEASSPRSYRPSNASNIFERFLFIGYPCLVAGFLLVIGAKGCDSLGNRWASRLSANSRMAEDKFDYRYAKQINSLRAQIDDINASSDPNRERIQELNKRISDLNSEKNKERQKLMTGSWFELNSAAKTARANNQAWGFFRELAFVFGSMVLSVGLLILGVAGNQSEKWTCLIMLAIITFSIYIGGFAWFSSIAGNVPGGMGF